MDRPIERRVGPDKVRVMWRFFRRNKNDQPSTLFHGLSGSKTLPTGLWLKAERKVGLQSGAKHTFETGFHLFSTEDEAIEYRKRFKDPTDLVVCKVWAGGLRRKPRARNGVWLADWMHIETNEWFVSRAIHYGKINYGAARRTTQRRRSTSP